MNIQISRVMRRKNCGDPLGQYSGVLPGLLLPERTGRKGLVRTAKMPTNNLPLPVSAAAPPIKAGPPVTFLMVSFEAQKFLILTIDEA